MSTLDDLTEQEQRLIAADFAERVLPLFEAEYPDDDRPRKSIDAARAYARGEITKAQRDAAGAAAGAAAWAAAGAAAWAAARAAAGAAAGAAAWDAAGDAARAAGAAARDAARDAAKTKALSRLSKIVRKHYPIPPRWGRRG